MLILLFFIICIGCVAYASYLIKKETLLIEFYIQKKLSQIIEKSAEITGSEYDLKVYNSIVISVFNLLLQEESIFPLIDKINQYADVAKKLNRLDLEKRLLHFVQGLDIVASTMIQTDISIALLKEQAPTWEWKAIKEGIHWNYQGTKDEETVLFVKQEVVDTSDLTIYKNMNGETFYEWLKTNIKE